MGKLVWLASYPKSGNTWLRAFLHNYLYQPEQPYDINKLNHLSVRENSPAHFKPLDPRPPSEYSPQDVQRMRPSAHKELTKVFPGLVFVKTHNACLQLHDVPLITPELTAGAVYLVRDPRDIAVSYAAHQGRTIDQTIAGMADLRANAGSDRNGVFEWRSSWSVHTYFWTIKRGANLLVLRYEDLLRQPKTYFGDLLRFFGVDPPHNLLNRAIEFSEFSVMRQQEDANGFGERPAEASDCFFRRGQAAQWQDVLSREQVCMIERFHCVEMRRFGYAPTIYH